MKLLDSEVAAAAIGSTTRHVQKLVKAGKLTNHGTPRRIRVHADELLRKVESGEITGGRNA